MKKTVAGLTIVLLFTLLSASACNSEDDPVVLKNGKYFMEQTEKDEIFSPHITINSDTFIFSYDSLSSYLPYGTYTINDDFLTMKTDGESYTYVFKIDGDILLFQEEKSSSVKLIDNRFGVEIPDQAEFKLSDD